MHNLKTNFKLKAVSLSMMTMLLNGAPGRCGFNGSSEEEAKAAPKVETQGKKLAKLEENARNAKERVANHRKPVAGRKQQEATGIDDGQDSDSGIEEEAGAVVPGNNQTNDIAAAASLSEQLDGDGTVDLQENAAEETGDEDGLTIATDNQMNNVKTEITQALKAQAETIMKNEQSGHTKIAQGYNILLSNLEDAIGAKYALTMIQKSKYKREIKSEFKKYTKEEQMEDAIKALNNTKDQDIRSYLISITSMSKEHITGEKRLEKLQKVLKEQYKIIYKIKVANYYKNKYIACLKQKNASIQTWQAKRDSNVSEKLRKTINPFNNTQTKRKNKDRIKDPIDASSISAPIAIKTN